MSRHRSDDGSRVLAYGEPQDDAVKIKPAHILP